MRRATIAAIAGLCWLTAGAAAASADPFTVSFNEGFVKLGSDPAFQDAQILAPPDTASFSGTIDTGTGEWSSSAGQLAPERPFSFQSPFGPVSGTTRLDATAPTTGTFDAGSGDLTADVTLLATITINSVSFIGPSKCLGTATPAQTAFSSANSLGAHAGHPFDQGLDQAGAIAAAWTDFSVVADSDPSYTGSSTVCPYIDGYTDGPGGAWLGFDPNPPPPPPSGGGGTAAVPSQQAATATASVAPAAKRCRKGRKLRHGRCVKRKKR